ncbi:MAG: hypothetical protein EYC70_04650 [Planctomycetota bacterium]|nr:MAG: hypothetical protein EYC70_04650 [Planctomycetota bacterium]
MLSLRCLSCVPLLTACAVWAGSLLPASASPAAAWRRADTATSSYLQQSPAAAWSAVTGGGSRSHLPKSALGGPVGQICSVDTSDAGTRPICSTSASLPRCSAQCDSGQQCSALLNTSGTGTVAQCSTLGTSGSACSVLPPATGPSGPALCSAFGTPANMSISCSVMRAGSSQFCSAVNPARLSDNQCSTFVAAHVLGRLNCSVLGGGGGTANVNSCSVRNAVPAGAQPKLCSTFAPQSNCSVAVGQRGRCTTLTAPAGTCSVFSALSHCSVIGGAAGTSCHWP